MSDARDADAQVARIGAGASEPVATGTGHESRDIRIRPVAIAFAILLVVGVVVQVLMYGVLVGFTARDVRRSDPASPLAVSYGRVAPPEPRLQVAPRDDLRRLHEREDDRLRGYGWVDRDAGVARIPIERAMDLLAARGLPSPAAPRAARGDAR